MCKRTLTVIIAALSVIILSCFPVRFFSNETKRIQDAADQLFNQSKDLMTSALGDAARMSFESVGIAFRQANILDPAAVRYVAVETAKMTAHRAAELLFESQASEIDRIFGVNRSGAVIAVLLTTYVNPTLDDIINETVTWQMHMHDSGYTGDTSAPDIGAIIDRHLSGFSFAEALQMIRGFATENKAPEYFASVAMQAVNSRSYCATRNWKDHGVVYQYRIIDDSLQMKRADSSWEPLTSHPFEGTPVSIAADNNRLLVLTDRHELWWYLPIDDQAQWSIDLMNTAVAFTDLKPVVGEQLCDVMLPVFIGVTDSIIAMAASIPSLQKWFTRPANDSAVIRYWTERCSVYTETALNIERFLLTADSGKSFSAKTYADWSSRYHKGGSWANLLSWTDGTDTLTRGGNLDREKITDIAVGNWNGTVVTAYALAEGKIWFLDEEIIQPEWKPIERWNDGWTLIGQRNYEQIGDSPYPLDSTCDIEASNSVISVIKKTSSATQIYWLRWDYHQKDDFVYWPLDWCNHAWHFVEYSGSDVRNFRISTIENIDPRENGTVWSVPAPAFTLHEYIPQPGYKGIFGDVPREMVDSYPVDLYLGIGANTVFHYSNNHSRAVTNGPVRWEKVVD